MYQSIFKRFFDIIFSIVLIVLLIPVYILTGLGIWMTMGSPILFYQERVGKDLTIFSIKKFRTMRNQRSIQDSDINRLTKLGAFLRKFSIDEFPQILNILMGDMSFIGPRPLLKKYIPYYSKKEIRRHEVRPGMTSLAGINGRSYLTWEEQFNYDVEYIDKLSFKLDFYIFLKTIPKVLQSSDMMVVGRKNIESFDVYRKNQIAKNEIEL